MRKIFVLMLMLTLLVGCSVNDSGSGSNTIIGGDGPADGNGGGGLVFDEGFYTLDANYVGENKWEYSVSADMPNPCYSFDTEVIIAESYPEQVTVIVKVSEPGADQACAQVIDSQTVTGEYQASEGASVVLSVE